MTTIFNYRNVRKKLFRNFVRCPRSLLTARHHNLFVRWWWWWWWAALAGIAIDTASARWTVRLINVPKAYAGRRGLKLLWYLLFTFTTLGGLLQQGEPHADLKNGMGSGPLPAQLNNNENKKKWIKIRSIDRFRQIDSLVFFWIVNINEFKNGYRRNCRLDRTNIMFRFLLTSPLCGERTTARFWVNVECPRHRVVIH